MKREEIKSIFPDATDEQLKAVMDLNGKEVEKNKKLESELKEKKEELENLNTEMETLKTANASGDEWKAKFEALQADNEAKARQAEADRLIAEKKADVEKRFSACIGEKQFSHEAIKASYLQKFTDALDSEDYKGKGDAEIFHALTKDDATAFTGVTAVKLQGGTPQGVGKTYKTKDDIMAIQDRNERRNAIAQNLELFGKGE